MTVQRTPQRINRNRPPVPSTARRPHASRATLCFILLALAVMASGCGPKTPVGGPASPGGTSPVGDDPGRPVLTAAAAALDKRDATQFKASLSAPLRQVVGELLDLSGPGATGLAQALRDGKLVAEYETVRVYETRVDGQTFSFRMVKEDGQWLLSDL